MEFGLSQEQVILEESVCKFLASEVPLDAVRGDDAIGGARCADCIH